MIWSPRKNRRRREFEERKRVAKVELAAVLARMTSKFEVVTEATQYANVSFRNLTRTFEFFTTPEMIRILAGVPEIAEVDNILYDVTYAKNLMLARTPLYDQVHKEYLGFSARQFWANIA